MLGWCDEKKVAKALEIPKGKKVMLVILLGYSAQVLKEKEKKNKEDIISFDKY